MRFSTFTVSLLVVLLGFAFPALTAPSQPVDDLEIFQWGGDCYLWWSQPEADLCGSPADVYTYRIYASTDPYFVPGPEHLLAVTSDEYYLVLQDAETFPRRYYRVTAQTREMNRVEEVRFNPPQLDLGTVPLGWHTAEFWLVNEGEWTLELEAIHCPQPEVTVWSGPGSLSPGDSAMVELHLELTTDLDLHTLVLVTSPQLRGDAALPVSAQPRLTDPRYLPAANQWGAQLKSTLASLVTNHNVLSYTEAREAMFGDLDNVNGAVQCVYTGQWVTTSGIPDPNYMNTEHTWPQSMGASGDARSDLFHLSPTMSSAISVRGILPFG